MNKTILQDDMLMKKLDVSTINRLICYTDKGILTLQIRKGDNQYHLCLDSVPLEKEVNKEIMELLFPLQTLEAQKVNKEITEAQLPVKSKGRPKGAKNR